MIENETEWPIDFGRDVIEGLIEHEDAGIPLARRAKVQCVGRPGI